MERPIARRVIADKYRLERPLAAGGMGSVWAAWNTHLDVPVAVKFMAPALAGSADLVARFEREARAAAQLRSPHVVQIFEHGLEGETPFIVMELLEGEDLGARIRRRGRLPVGETARVVAGVCKALRRAHAMGMVHRDLKPANIFLARTGDPDDDDETVKVLDFGVVKSLGEAAAREVTKTGELIGTPSYMSPEQARNTKAVDHRSDLWSLGIITYRALTSTLPFPDDAGLQRLMRICREPIPPPSSVVPDLGPEIDAFFARALAISPDARFQSAREMAAAMAALAGVPASSRSGRRDSLADGAPPSMNMYTMKAYVYTSAEKPAESLTTERPRRRRARAPDAPSLDPSPAPVGRRSPPFPFAPARAPLSADGATQVSGRDQAAHAHEESPGVSIVAGALADASGPLPPISSGSLGTLHSAGLPRPPGMRPAASRLATLGAAIVVASALVGAASIVAPGAPGEAAAPAGGASAATILFAAGGLAASTATSAAALAATSAAEPGAATQAPDARAPGPIAGAPSTAADTSRAGASTAPSTSARGRATTTPRSAPQGGGERAQPATAAGHRRGPPPRREGGIGRRPTY